AVEPFGKRRGMGLVEIGGPLVQNFEAGEFLRCVFKDGAEDVPVLGEAVVVDLVHAQVIGAGGVELQEEVARRRLVAREGKKASPPRFWVAAGMAHLD